MGNQRTSQAKANELKEEVNVFLRFVASLPLVLPVLPRECVVILREMRLKHRVRRGAAS